MTAWLDTAFSGASTIAAWLALVIALFSNQTGKKALRIAQAESERKIPRIVPYLVDSVATADKRALRTIELALALSNPSDSPNTIARADLAISHVVQDHALVQLLLPVTASKAEPHSNALAIPLRIDAHTTVTGQLSFVVPSELVDPANVRRYELQLTDSQGTIVPLEIRVLKEIESEDR